MAYITDDLASYLLSENIVEPNSMYVDSEPSFQELDGLIGSENTPNLLHTVAVSSGSDNPKWARSTYFCVFRVRGRNKNLKKAASDRAVLLYDELLGSVTIQVGTNLYYQFNSTETPRFSGYYDGSEPIYTFALSIVRESTVDIGNRKTF